MKVIFLDIDGVLNSYDFYNECDDFTVAVDEENLKNLKTIVDQTGAKIVLSSSWRHGWNEDYEACGDDVKRMLNQFQTFDLKIISRTGKDMMFRRENEIAKWIKESKERIEGYVILDDGPFEWEKRGLQSHVVQTDFKKGGLLKQHIEPAIEILNKAMPWTYRLRHLI